MNQRNKYFLFSSANTFTKMHDSYFIIYQMQYINTCKYIKIFIREIFVIFPLDTLLCRLLSFFFFFFNPCWTAHICCSQDKAPRTVFHKYKYFFYDELASCMSLYQLVCPVSIRKTRCCSVRRKTAFHVLLRRFFLPSQRSLFGL